MQAQAGIGTKSDAFVFLHSLLSQFDLAVNHPAITFALLKKSGQKADFLFKTGNLK